MVRCEELRDASTALLHCRTLIRTAATCFLPSARNSNGGLQAVVCSRTTTCRLVPGAPWSRFRVPRRLRGWHTQGYGHFEARFADERANARHVSGWQVCGRIAAGPTSIYPTRCRECLSCKQRRRCSTCAGRANERSGARGVWR